MYGLMMLHYFSTRRCPEQAILIQKKTPQGANNTGPITQHDFV
jgi:hypothetical protein